MKNKQNIIIAVVLVVVLIAAALFIAYSDDDRYNWFTTYKHEGTQPYDLNLFRETVSNSYGEDKFKEFRNFNTDSLPADVSGNLFVYIAGNTYVDSLEREAMLNFAESGNNVFISAKSAHSLLTYMFEDCLGENEKPLKERRGKNLEVYLTEEGEGSSPIEISWVVREDEERYDWQYFNFGTCLNEGYTTLGEFKNVDMVFPNYIEVPYGNGKLLLHTTPMIFSNFYFKEKGVFDHVNKILDPLDGNKVYYYNPEPSRIRAGGGGMGISDSPLQFILAHKSLKWAWYLILTLVVIYIVNYARRYQKSIPVFSVPDNETAIYLDVVSRLYRKEGKHMNIVKIQERLLKRHLYNRYRIPAHTIDETFYREAEIKLEIDKSELKKLFTLLERAKNNSTLTDKDLIEIDEKIKAFYEKCP